MYNEDEAAVSSENIEDENNNQQESNCPKRNKKPIMRLAPYVSYIHSKEAENNESGEYYNEETGKVIARIMYHYSDNYECIRESKIELV